jgi:hypothetical protein
MLRMLQRFDNEAKLEDELKWSKLAKALGSDGKGTC